MSLRRFFVQTDDGPRPAGGKAEAIIATLSNADLREWVDQYIYVIGRSLNEYSKNPTERGFMDEAVEASRLLHLCMQHLSQRV